MLILSVNCRSKPALRDIWFNFFSSNELFCADNLLPAPPTLDKIKEIWYSTTVIDCKVSRTNPLPTFRWQYQSELCLNDNRECKPSDSKWQGVSAPFSVSPAVDVATGVSKLTLPQDLQSAFFRCVATNPMGSDDYVMRFLGGRLIYLLANVPSGDERREQLYSLAAARQVFQMCLFV